MREMKFKAYDKEYGLSDPFTFGWVITFKTKTVFKSHVSEGMQVMQYTGLHDKNGKEIYEGDVIRCQTNNKFKYPHKGQVIYLKHIAGFGITTEPIISESTGKEEEAFTYFNYNENFEVIGNIYENPDLL